MKPWALPVAVVLSGLVGCGPEYHRASAGRLDKPVAEVDRISFLTMPAAINFDNVPGPDGLRVQAMCFQLVRAQSVAVSGTVDFLLYEGNVDAAELDTRKPALVWSFPPEKLAAHATASVAGWSYVMELRWGPRVPTGRTVSLAARYSSPGGRVIYSRPVIIAMRHITPSSKY